MCGGADGSRTCAYRIPFSETEKAELKNDVALQTQNALRQIHLHGFDGLSALGIVAIANDPRHPGVGRQK